MADAQTIDPEVREAIENLKPGHSPERRESVRRPYSVVQNIAPATEMIVPEEDAFFPVTCHDLSTRGFAFYSMRPPDFKSLVLALNLGENVIHVAAEVRHCTKVEVFHDGRVERVDENAQKPGGGEPGGKQSKAMVLVGCEFIQRL